MRLLRAPLRCARRECSVSASEPRVAGRSGVEGAGDSGWSNPPRGVEGAERANCGDRELGANM
eukprot:3807579-Prymnesium_polylepis.1